MPKDSEKRKILLLYSAKLEGNGVTKKHTFWKTCCMLATTRKGTRQRPETRANNKEYNKVKGKSVLFKNISFFLSFTKNRLHPIQAFVNNRL